MKIRILGTGYGECKVKKKNSKDFRRMGGVIIDERLLLDAPEDIFDVSEELGFSDMFDKVTDILISHSHKGHFSPEAITRLAEKRPISIYASREVLALLPEDSKAERHIISSFVPAEIGEYKVIPVKSNHETDNHGEECFNFVISSDKTLLYALDGGFIPYETWKFLSDLKLDAVISECALEAKEPSREAIYHNGIDGVRAVKGILCGSGILSENGKFILTHIPTDRKRSVHEELSEIARAYGMNVAYDGYFFSL